MRRFALSPGRTAIICLVTAAVLSGVLDAGGGLEPAAGGGGKNSEQRTA